MLQWAYIEYYRRYYKLKNNQVICGDCVDVLLHFPSNSIDMIVTSPPYVTSYEYADLHQLSSLWLDCANDYRDLRAGSIGSLYHKFDFEKEMGRLNFTGKTIVSSLSKRDKSKARSVAKYFFDIPKSILNPESSGISKTGLSIPSIASNIGLIISTRTSPPR